MDVHFRGFSPDLCFSKHHSELRVSLHPLTQLCLHFPFNLRFNFLVIRFKYCFEVRRFCDFNSTITPSFTKTKSSCGSIFHIIGKKHLSLMGGLMYLSVLKRLVATQVTRTRCQITRSLYLP